MEQRGRWLLISAAGLVIVYSIVVLGFVAASPDLRLRCLLVDDQVMSDSPQGVEIYPPAEDDATLGLEWCKGARPKERDVLLRIGDRRTRTFLDFTQVLIALRNAQIPIGWQLPAGADPSELVMDESVWLVGEEVGEEGETRRWVRIEFLRAKSAEKHTSWLLVQSLPLGEVALLFVWFILQLAVLAVGALVFWNRPFDRAARLFFVMCIVNLGAFVGGYHWWIVAGSVWLVTPFAVCAMLVPVVTLHFFLVFPRPDARLSKHWLWPVAALYGVPLIAISSVVALLGYAGWLQDEIGPGGEISAIVTALGQLRWLIYAYLALAAGYFFVTLLVVRQNFLASRNPLERSQVRWIWTVGKVAAFCVAGTLYLALFRRTEFAFGTARILMFLASLSFMLAYAVGIVRYKLMLVDQIVSKGVLYYAVSSGLTLMFGLTVAAGVLATEMLNVSLSRQQAVMVAAVMVLSVTMLLGLRDLFQQTIDRQFFREKYQLDKALGRMNRTVGQLVTPESLAEMMLGSCRDVLGVERAALFLRSSTQGPLQLVAAYAADNIPLQFTPEEPLIDVLREGRSLQRVTPGSRSEMSPVQTRLRELEIDLVHALEVDQGIRGLVMLGKKKNAAAFTAEDLTFLNALCQITNVALHSAKVDRDINRLNEELRMKLETIAVQNRQITLLQSELAETQEESSVVSRIPERGPFRRGAIKGNSPAICSILDTVRKVAGSQSSVLIRGESGTGKELLAQVLHDNSPRENGPMICVNCAALSAGLMESELFGHVKGSFTGAHRDKVGRFEAANGGSLFLDEIGDITLETQIKLLRVLQERCFEPVGGTQTIHVDVRLITATHQNLEQLISVSKFREDLYYRLNVISITLPPLRDRKEDIFELAHYFLRQATRRLGKRIRGIEEGALAALERNYWQGNIRELENAIERAVVLAEGDRISLHDLPAEISRPASGLPSHVLETKPVITRADRAGWRTEDRPADPAILLKPHAEREQLEAALHHCEGNKAQAARLLGLPRSTYYSKLKKYGIE